MSEHIRLVLKDLDGDQIETMKKILDGFTWEMVDDIACMGRVFPVQDATPLSRDDIERELACAALMQFFGIHNYADLDDNQRILGVSLYCKALSEMETYKVRERLDMIFKDA